MAHFKRRVNITSRELAKQAARIADELKATEITILDVRKLSDITDYFVICTGDNRRQLTAVQRRILNTCRQPGTTTPRLEGEPGSSWVLLDLVDVVVHLFDPESRAFYDLELLWGDAPKVAWAPAKPSDR
jgi:ribosome-associated protein